MTVSPRAPATRARRHERLVEASGLRRHRRRRSAVVIAAVALVTVAGGPGPATSGASGAKSSTVATASFPSTPAGKQAKWLFNGVLHHPIPAAQVAAHFDTAYLSTLPAPAATTLNASFAGITRLQLDGITTSTPDSIEFVVTVNATSEQQVNIAVDAHGLISSLHLQPVGPAPTTTTPTPLPEPVVEGMRQISVGVGSPPLKGTLTLPPGKGPFPAVVLVSGSGPSNQDESNGPNRPFLDIAVGLAARGVATLRYDKRTLDYPASIDPSTFTPTDEYVPDALAAIRLLEHEPVIDPHLIFVLGHSQGGTYAPLIAKDAPEVAGVVLLAAAAEPLGAAILRQVRYLATLPGTTGSQAKRELPEITVIASQMDDAAALEKDNPGMNILDGTSPAYYLSALRYDEVATARAIPQPLLLLQGGRDYQVTVANDLDAWLRGLKGRTGVTVVQFPLADHLLLDGTGRPTPLEYEKPGHIDPKVTPTIALWIERVASRLTRAPAPAGTPR